MLTNRVMWSAIFISFVHLCGVTDVMIGIGADMLSCIGSIPMATPAITWEFMVAEASAVDVLTDLLEAVTFDVVTVIDVDILADENVNGSEAVITSLEFTLPAP